MPSAIRYVSQQNFVLWDVHADDLVVEARAGRPHFMLLDAFMAPSEILGVNPELFRTHMSHEHVDFVCRSQFQMSLAFALYGGAV